VNAYLAILISKLLRKKTIVVAGGYDVVSLPEIDYGLIRHKKTIKRVKFVLNYATLILPFSNHSKGEILKISNPKNIKTLYLGVDTKKYKPGSKKDIVATIGGITTQTLKRKGLETFVRSSTNMPEFTFYLIGKHFDEGAVSYLKSISKDNLIYTGYLEKEDLLNILSNTKVYVQVSAHEGFGLALAESMSCGCIPIVTKKGSIPEVVGDKGLYVPFGDVISTVATIKKAIKMDIEELNPRERIINKFSIQERERKLIKIITKLTEN
jgi:glycosyltransferase involved in cell wall biosynthesis